MPQSPNPADDDLTAYVAAIEAALARGRGRDVALSGRDFALARTWHAGGVPLAVVLATVGEHFAAGHGGHSLAYLRRHVEARARRSRATQAVGATKARPRDDVAVARDWLARLRAWLDARAGDATAFHALRAHAGALARRLEAPALEPPDELDAALAALDDALSEAALGACGEEAAARFRAEAARAVGRQRGRLDETALEAALRRYVRRRARAAWDVPERG
jgi:hypothetical protein